MLSGSPQERFPFALSSNEHYETVVEVLRAILDQVDLDFFHSPYGLIPHVAQLLGLSTPLMGSGHSGYSLHGISRQLRSTAGLGALWAMPLAERRRILDELYNYIAPVVLGEQSIFAVNQARVLASFGQLPRAGLSMSGWEEALLRRMEAGAPLLTRLLRRRPGFAHIAHYGHDVDLTREFSFLRAADAEQRALWDAGSFPITVEIELQGLVRDGSAPRTVFGWVIMVGNTTECLLAERKLRERKLRQAARLAQALGARIVGTAGLVASFSRGGRLFTGLAPGVGVTTGHAYTILNVVGVLRRAVELVGLDLRRATVGVVGAAGSIGSGCAQLLVQQGVERLLLVDQTSMVSGARLEQLVKELVRQKPEIAVEVTSDLGALNRADALVVATSSTHAFIESAHLSPGAIVVDDSFPKNVSRELLDLRPDVLLLEGGLIQLPYEVYVSSAKNMPDLLDAPVTRMVSCRETYGCFAETILLACEERYDDFGLGFARPDLAQEIGRVAASYGLSDAPLQCYDEAIDPQRIERCRRALGQRGLLL